MFVTTFGTRGSLPVSGPNRLKYGGNTTCLQVESQCLAPRTVLAVDAGTGFLPLARQALASGVERMIVLHTHYHHDHTQGMLIAPPVYMDALAMEIFGPVDREMGPRDVYDALMRPPLHPVALGSIAHHIVFQRIENPATCAILIHPVSGSAMVDIETLNKATKANGEISFPDGKQQPLKECMVITMHYTDHPERTIAYRFDEKPTGKAFAFLTDEEVRASTPATLKRFLSNVDLLIQDAQFIDSAYASRAAGWGHGTPSYAVGLSNESNVKRLGLTHHDPSATDLEIDMLLAEAKKAVGTGSLEVFACYDYLRVAI